MPTPEEILAGLARIANEAQSLALAWHALVLALLAASFAGFRPSRRIAGALLTLPLASAGVLAAMHHNPFNAAVMGSLAVVLAAVAFRLDAERVARGSRGYAFVGWALIAFAWVYPHFLSPATPVFAYAYASPMGLIPCPSLALVAGFSLLCGGLGSRAWCLVLGGAAAFYATFGMLRLGVHLDAGLLVGAAALFAVARELRPPSPERA